MLLMELLRQKCSAKTQSGRPCRQFASHGSNLCYRHGGVSLGKVLCTCGRLRFPHSTNYLGRCGQPRLEIVPKKRANKIVAESEAVESAAAVNPAPVQVVEPPTVVSTPPEPAPDPWEGVSEETRRAAEAQGLVPATWEDVRLEQVEDELAELERQYKSLDGLAFAEGKQALLLREITRLEQERRGLQYYGWPKPPQEAKEDPKAAYLSKLDARFLLAGGGWGARTADAEAVFGFGRARYGGA